MRRRSVLLAFLAVSAMVACTSASGRPGTAAPEGSDGPDGMFCATPPLVATAVAGSPWVRMRPPAMSASERLVALKATQIGFLAMTREQLGRDAKIVSGFRHRLLLSTDGLIWEESPPPPSAQLNPTIYFSGVAQGATRMVAAGGAILAEGATVWVSATNGTWQPVVISDGNGFDGVEWTPMGFLAFGASGVVLASANGLDWAAKVYPAAGLRTAACSVDTCVLGGSTSFVVLDTESNRGSVASLDCDSPVCVTDPNGKKFPPPVDHIAYGHGSFFAETADVGMGRAGFGSRDGMTWKRQALAATPQAFTRDLAVRISGQAQVEVWNEGGEQQTIQVTNDNERELSCSAFECVVLKHSGDFTLLLIPEADKATGCGDGGPSAF